MRNRIEGLFQVKLARAVRKVKASAAIALLCAATVAVGSSATQTQASERVDSRFLIQRSPAAAPMGFAGVCGRYSWACAGSSKSANVQLDMNKIKRLNASINRRVNEISDSQQYRVKEYWALPTRRGGDCEDFVLLKKRELIKMGYPPEALLIATVLDKKRNAHAVLIMRTSNGDYVLDNLVNQIKPWRKTGYTFLRMQSPKSPNNWVAVLTGGILKS
ncbi:transglutaminase-like cysteine peptidase [Halocynthiibacter sp. C4]|uniref:transglutaminase-like cysteine peptidase n=1 Tax=Halocynthiibacter sp. C4 TaxID=2992758 RepID=UPI00237B7431|nr:transglutaminase-like cysteine peptidase [Halocynthiibacter sp. C4]MDE0590930.1 transglutaminase-like cysteine peptidase [Halocynthiibacter sp. C4]